MIKALAEKYSDYIIERRRWYHANPELSGEEKETRAQIRRDLEAMGITDIREMDNCYGLIATIHGGKSGKTVALRTDTDALKIPEETGLPKANVLSYVLEDGAKVMIRPSGTEPKIKAYYTTLGKDLEAAQAEKDRLSEAIKPIFS